VHHRQVRPSPEANAPAVSNVLLGSLTVLNQSPPAFQWRASRNSAAKSRVLNILPITVLL
jgi:hypothetical protein